MVNTIEGHNKVKGKRFSIVISRFNDFITKRLLEGCLRELSRCGVKENEITVAWVPGAFEIPVAALKFAQKKSIAAVICLRVVIRGETMHFELVAQGAASGIAQAALMTGKPMIFEVLTTETVEQATKRCGQNGENKGMTAARNAVEMVHLLDQI